MLCVYALTMPDGLLVGDPMCKNFIVIKTINCTDVTDASNIKTTSLSVCLAFES